MLKAVYIILKSNPPSLTKRNKTAFSMYNPNILFSLFIVYSTHLYGFIVAISYSYTKFPNNFVTNN
jgi:hypothetical protein